MSARFIVGLFVGSLIPVATFCMAHFQTGWIGHALVLAGLVFSAPTVYEWGVAAFKSKVKAVGFVILMEGIMVLASVPYLPFVCLAYLVGINAYQTGINLHAKELRSVRASHAARSKTQKPARKAKPSVRLHAA